MMPQPHIIFNEAAPERQQEQNISSFCAIDLSLMCSGNKNNMGHSAGVTPQHIVLNRGARLRILAVLMTHGRQGGRRDNINDINVSQHQNRRDLGVSWSSSDVNDGIGSSKVIAMVTPDDINPYTGCLDPGRSKDRSCLMPTAIAMPQQPLMGAILDAAGATKAAADLFPAVSIALAREAGALLTWAASPGVDLLARARLRVYVPVPAAPSSFSPRPPPLSVWATVWQWTVDLQRWVDEMGHEEAIARLGRLVLAHGIPHGVGVAGDSALWSSCLDHSPPPPPHPAPPPASASPSAFATRASWSTSSFSSKAQGKGEAVGGKQADDDSSWSGTPKYSPPHHLQTQQSRCTLDEMLDELEGLDLQPGTAIGLQPPNPIFGYPPSGTTTTTTTDTSTSGRQSTGWSQEDLPAGDQLRADSEYDSGSNDGTFTPRLSSINTEFIDPNDLDSVVMVTPPSVSPHSQSPYLYQHQQKQRRQQRHRQGEHRPSHTQKESTSTTTASVPSPGSTAKEDACRGPASFPTTPLTPSNPPPLKTPSPTLTCTNKDISSVLKLVRHDAKFGTDEYRISQQALKAVEQWQSNWNY